MAKQIIFVFICVHMCNAGVVSRNFKNDILNLEFPEAENSNDNSISATSTQSDDKEINANDTFLNFDPEISATDGKTTSEALNMTENNFPKNNSEDTEGTSLLSSEVISHIFENISQSLVNVDKHSEDLNHQDEEMDEAEASDKENVPASDVPLVAISMQINAKSSNGSSALKIHDGINATGGVQGGDVGFAFNHKDSSVISDLDRQRNNSSHKESSFEEDQVFRTNTNSAMPALNDTDLTFAGHFLGEVNSLDNTGNLESNATEIVGQEPNEIKDTVKSNSSDGIFATVGLDFLINSEVVKNAAMAMEVFNPPDPSITDHIIEENEFHHLVDLMLPSLSEEQNLTANHISIIEDQKDLNNSAFIDGFEGSTAELDLGEHITLHFEKGNETLTMLNPSNAPEDGHETSTVQTPSDALNGGIDTSTLSNSSNAFDKNETGLIDLSGILEDINETLQFINVTALEEISKITLPELSISVPAVNANTTATRKCPSPGICLFWFLARNACSVDSQCLGSKICCRIRCSKVCIEV